MPAMLRRWIDEGQLQATFLQFRYDAEEFVIDASARKQMLLAGTRRFVSRLILAGLVRV